MTNKEMYNYINEAELDEIIAIRQLEKEWEEKEITLPQYMVDAVKREGVKPVAKKTYTMPTKVELDINWLKKQVNQLKYTVVRLEEKINNIEKKF